MDMSWLVAGTDLAGGVRIRGGHAAHDAMVEYLSGHLGLPVSWWHELPAADGLGAFVLSAEAFDALMPGYDTLALSVLLNARDVRNSHEAPDARGARAADASVASAPDLALDREIAVALLGSPNPPVFDSVQAFASQVRVQRRISQAARHTAVAFKTLAAERPVGYWVYEEEAGFLLGEQAGLVEALRAATQPSVTGQLYDFSCYRASEYVILLGMAQEMTECDPALLQRLETRSRRRAIRSREFHDVFLDEYGSLEQPLPARYFVPGDRLWFRNPDERSSDALGYEGSWVVYLGGGLFSNFWKSEHPYTLEEKCLEIFHWRDGAYQDDAGEWQMDEARVDEQVARTRADEGRRSTVMKRMLRMRDPQGVYAEGGCLDASRERAKPVWPGAGRLCFLQA